MTVNNVFKPIYRPSGQVRKRAKEMMFRILSVELEKTKGMPGYKPFSEKELKQSIEDQYVFLGSRDVTHNKFHKAFFSRKSPWTWVTAVPSLGFFQAFFAEGVLIRELFFGTQGLRAQSKMKKKPIVWYGHCRTPERAQQYVRETDKKFDIIWKGDKLGYRVYRRAFVDPRNPQKVLTIQDYRGPIRVKKVTTYTV